MSKRKPRPAPPVPAAFTGADHEAMDDMGLRVVSYQHVSTPHDAEGRSWALPRDAIGADGKTLILWRAAGDEANMYAGSGWEPWHDGMFGGHYACFGSALAWVRQSRSLRVWAQSAQTGKATDFGGV